MSSGTPTIPGEERPCAPVSLGLWLVTGLLLLRWVKRRSVPVLAAIAGVWVLAEFWPDLPRICRLILCVAGCAGCHAGGLWLARRPQPRPWVAELLHLCGTLLLGLVLLPRGLVYRCGEATSDALLLWGLAAVALCWGLRSAAQGVLAAVVFLEWLVQICGYPGMGGLLAWVGVISPHAIAVPGRLDALVYWLPVVAGIGCCWPGWRQRSLLLLVVGVTAAGCGLFLPLPMDNPAAVVAFLCPLAAVLAGLGEWLRQRRPVAFPAGSLCLLLFGQGFYLLSLPFVGMVHHAWTGFDWRAPTPWYLLFLCVSSVVLWVHVWVGGCRQPGWLRTSLLWRVDRLLLPVLLVAGLVYVAPLPDCGLAVDAPWRNGILWLVFLWQVLAWTWWVRCDGPPPVPEGSLCASAVVLGGGLLFSLFLVLVCGVLEHSGRMWLLALVPVVYVGGLLARRAWRRIWQ